MKKKILIVDDEESVRYSFKRFLTDPQIQVVEAQNGAEAMVKFRKNAFDLIVLDVRLPDISGLEVLSQMKSLDPKAVVIVITAFGTTEIAIEAIKLGAYDYILKPFEIPEVQKIITDALNSSHLMRTKVIFENGDQKKAGDRMIGHSPLMQQVYKMIGRVASSDVNVLIRGESGTGKELAARAIYQHGKRSQKPFLIVNCAAIPETLLESELFGYEKGAFTGASQRKIGKFEQADGGTIFLDEIGDMTLTTQAKVLRILQSGSFERLGGDDNIHIDVRVIAATNRNLEKAIEEKKFREDLYYRLKVVTITLPPLRARAEDILDLIRYFLDKHCLLRKNNTLSISPDAIEVMNKYHWPGNIRELENVIKRAIVLTKGSLITKELIAEEFQVEYDRDKSNVGRTWSALSLQEMEKYSGFYYEKIMSETEKHLIEMVLEACQGNQVQAAKILGISRMMLRDRIQKYNITKEIIITNL